MGYISLILSLRSRTRSSLVVHIYSNSDLMSFDNNLDTYLSRTLGLLGGFCVLGLNLTILVHSILSIGAALQ